MKVKKVIKKKRLKVLDCKKVPSLSLPAFADQHDVLGELFAIVALELHGFHLEAGVVLILADGVCLEGHVGAAVSVTRRTVIHFDGFL